MGNYFCGNSSAGGWVGFNDPNHSGPHPNKSIGLSAQLPYGFDYDPEDVRNAGPCFAYSLPVRSFHTRRDRVASLTTCR